MDLSKTRTLADVYAQLAARVAQSPMSELIVSNGDWHEAQLKEQRLPLRRNLDKVAPNNPVVLVRGGHEYILNSAALRLYKIDEAIPEPAGGRITRYEDGTLNGELIREHRGIVFAVLYQFSASARRDARHVSIPHLAPESHVWPLPFTQDRSLFR